MTYRLGSWEGGSKTKYCRLYPSLISPALAQRSQGTVHSLVVAPRSVLLRRARINNAAPKRQTSTLYEYAPWTNALKFLCRLRSLRTQLCRHFSYPCHTAISRDVCDPKYFTHIRTLKKVVSHGSRRSFRLRIQMGR